MPQHFPSPKNVSVKIQFTVIVKHEGVRGLTQSIASSVYSVYADENY